MGLCNACCLLLDSFRLLRHVLDSRIYHELVQITQMKKERNKINVVAVLYSHYTHLVVSR